MRNLEYWKYRLKYLYGKNLRLKKPVDVSLELASHCNMKCSYCYHADDMPGFLKGYMAKETAYKIIREAAELKVSSLKFNWKGESTLNPHYYSIAKYAYELSSDGVFIDRLANSNFKFPTNSPDIFEGLSYMTKVKISYDSFIKDVFEKQRAGGNHDLTTRNIDKFYYHPLRLQSKTKMVIQAVRTSANKNEDIKGECKKRWPQAEISIREVVDGRRDESINDLQNFKRNPKNRTPCKQAFVRLIFNHKGIASPCCPDIKEQFDFGDINKQSLLSIFNSHEARNLRKELKAGSAFSKDPCMNCSSFESYKGYKALWDS